MRMFILFAPKASSFQVLVKAEKNSNGVWIINDAVINYGAPTPALNSEVLWYGEC